jgi:serine/threonine-protein kinase/endoribonuclease IRE1
MSSPVIAAFDVLKSMDPDSTDLKILHQPLVPSMDDTIDMRDTWVGLTHEGGVFAMSESRYPYVTQRSQTATCYQLDNWGMLDLSERQKLLVGNHRARYPGVTPQRLDRLGIGRGDYDDSERDSRVGNTSPPVTPPEGTDSSPTNLGKTLIKKVTNHGKIVGSLCVFLGVLAFLVSNPQATQKYFEHAVEKQQLPSVVQLETQPSEPAVSPAPPVPGDFVEEAGAVIETEKSRKPNVKFADEPIEIDRKAEDSSVEPNGAVTPKRRKPHRGKRGGAGRNKNKNAAKEGEKSDEKEALPATNLNLVAPDGEVTEVTSNTVTLNNLTVYLEKVLGEYSVSDGLCCKANAAQVPVVREQLCTRRYGMGSPWPPRRFRLHS